MPAAAASAVAMTGELLFQQRCVSCHQPTGQGLPGTYPPLAGSEYATAANVAVPIRVLMHGIQGPIMVKGQRFEGVMPAYGLGVEMSDDEVASVLTYVRSAWGNTASAVTPQDVAGVRATPRTQTGAVTAEELRPMISGR
jgi:mono/diheme cytochrome c family protein